MPKEASAKRGNSPNEKLRMAVLGVNGRGKSHLDAFSGDKHNTEVAIICDPDESIGRKRVDDVEKKTGKAPKYVRDLRQVFDDKSIDAVSIATPNHWHSLASIWAMQAGKDVYCEKPVSHNVSEGRRMVEAARKYKRICQTGTQARSSKALAEAVEYLHTGQLGEIEIARGLCYKPRGSIGKVTAAQTPPKSVDYNIWCGPAPMAPLMRHKLHYDWHWVWDTGNGDLGNQGIHQMDLCRWALGVDQLCDSVVSVGGRFGYVDDGQTPNTIGSIFEFGKKRLIFEVRGLNTDAYRGAKVGNVIHCSKGYMVFTSSYGGAVAFDKDGQQIRAFKGSGDHFGNFVDAVRSRKQTDLRAEIEQGHKSSALCHLGNISHRLGQQVHVPDVFKTFESDKDATEMLTRGKSYLELNKVKLDGLMVQLGAKLEFNPATETFIGNSQADTMLTREYRAPFIVPAAGKV